MHAVTIRDGVAAERVDLEALMFRSSVHASRYAEQLRAHPDAVSIPAVQFAARQVRVADAGGAMVGFAVLLDAIGGSCELDSLFVDPAWMGRGVGRRLVEDAAATARRTGAAAIGVVANPEAHGFYVRMGFRENGQAPTRFGPAPRMRLALGGPRPAA